MTRKKTSRKKIHAGIFSQGLLTVTLNGLSERKFVKRKQSVGRRRLESSSFYLFYESVKRETKTMEREKKQQQQIGQKK